MSQMSYFAHFNHFAAIPHVGLAASGAGVKRGVAKYWAKMMQYGNGEAMGQLGRIGQLRRGEVWGEGELRYG